MTDDGRFKDAGSSLRRKRAGETAVSGSRMHDHYKRRDRESDRRRSGAAHSDEPRTRDGAPAHRAASPAHRQRVTALDKWPSASHSRKRTSTPDDGNDRHKRQRGRILASVAAEHNTVARVSLPFDARALSRRDLVTFEPLFARYLDLQKGLAIEDLDDEETRGRWKSFMGKWNRAELAEGWYDPEMFLRVAQEPGRRMSGNVPEREEGGDFAKSRTREKSSQADRRSYVVESERGKDGGKDGGYDLSTAVKQKDAPSEAYGSIDDDDDDDDDAEEKYGPAPPPGQASTAKPHTSSNQPQQGPKIPSKRDLEERRELEAEEHEARATHLRLERRAERKLHKDRLEELVPRAEPGTRERRLEKKREAGAANRTFRQGGEDEAVVGDGDLMGDDGGVDGYRKRLADTQRRKTQRELRREEEARARAAEHEERLRAYRSREEKTVDMLRELAKQRFG